MSIELALKGLIIGFSIAMPVGPIGLLCIRNVMAYGMLCGLATGLGAACADTIYGALAGFGVTAIGTFLETHGAYLQIGGALFLCYLGISTFIAQTAPIKGKGAIKGKESFLAHSKAFITTFFLTLTNPMTIISFAGVYAGLGIGHDKASIQGALIMTLGVFLGSAAWWMILSFTASLIKENMHVESSMWLNRLSGSMLFGLGALSLVL